MSKSTSPASKGAESSDDTGARLLSALRARRTYLLVYQDYRKTTPKPDFAGLLDALIDDTQDAVADLSRTLRLMDKSPIQAGVNEKLLQQGLARRGTASKLNFMLVGCTRTLAWYQDMPVAGDPAEIRTLWQDLAAMEERHLARIKELLGGVELVAGGSSETPEPDSEPGKRQGREAGPRRKGRTRKRMPANPTRRKPGKG